MCAYNKPPVAIPSPEFVCTLEVDYSRQGNVSPTQLLDERHVHIGFGMDDSTYITSKTTHMHDTLSVGSPHSQDTHLSTTPSSSGYRPQDMTGSYTASVPPFSPYPAYDTSLPTPVSIAGSPPLSERARKMPPTYNQHEEGAQAPSPPTAQRSWSYAPNITGASTASMTVPATTSEMLNVHSLNPTHSPEQQPAAPNLTPHFHWGEYTVSSHDANDDMPQGHPMFAPNIPPSVLMRSPSYGLPSTHVPLAPAVSHGSMPPDTTGMQSLMSHNMHPLYQNDLSNISLEYGQSYPSRKSSRAKASRSGRPTKRIRTSRTSFSRGSEDGYDSEGTAATAENAPLGEQDGAAPASPQILELNADASPEGRYLVELRCSLSEDKGKGMWEQIRQAFKKRFGSLKSKENLQMLLIRTVQKHAIWPEEEIQALKAAVEEYERRRYSEIRKIMKDKGGRRVWSWNEGCIAKQLAMLGVDEIVKTGKVRRKRKYAARETTGGEAWTAVPNNPFNTEPRILTHEEDEILLQAFCKLDSASPPPEQLAGVAANSPPASNPGANRSSCQSQSTRVAKQACEQMMARQDEQTYNGHDQYVS